MQDNTNHHQPMQPDQAPPSLLPQVLARIQQAEQVAKDTSLFTTAFTSPDWTWRVAALEQLVHAERALALSWLERALTDPHPTVRARAVHILGQHQASAMIQPALHDPDWQVREMAMLALGEPIDPMLPEFLEAEQDTPDAVMKRPQRALARDWNERTTPFEGELSMQPIDQMPRQTFAEENSPGTSHSKWQGSTWSSSKQQREKRPQQKKRLFTMVAALLVGIVLIGGMALIFAQIRNQPSPSPVGAYGSATPAHSPGTTTPWNACDDDSNTAEAALCAAHKETTLNITKPYGTHKVTFVRAYADTHQLLIVYTDGLATEDATSFESVTIQNGIVLNGGGSNGYSNPTTHQGYNVASFSTNAVPPGTTELQIQSIIDGFSGKSTPLTFTVPLHTNQKTVEVNQSATSKGIKLTLKRVVFTGSTTLFYVGPEPSANGGYISIFVQSITVNGQPLNYSGIQTDDNVQGNSLIDIAVNASLDKPGTWVIQIAGHQQGISPTWKWTFHFTVPTQ